MSFKEQRKTKQFRVGIIGGGPSGLVTLKLCLEIGRRRGIPLQVRLFEAEDDVGGVFSHKVWEEAELVSSKYLTAFSDFRVPSHLPDFLTPRQYVDYLRAFCQRFDLHHHIELSTRIVSIQRARCEDGINDDKEYSRNHDFNDRQARNPFTDNSNCHQFPDDGVHILHYRKNVVNRHGRDHIGEENDDDCDSRRKQKVETPGTKESMEKEGIWVCDAIAICSGLNQVPNLPDISGLHHVPTVLHSSIFQGRRTFEELVEKRKRERERKKRHFHYADISSNSSNNSNCSSNENSDCEHFKSKYSIGKNTRSTTYQINSRNNRENGGKNYTKTRRHDHSEDDEADRDLRLSVAVLGVGETGQDIAYLAVTSPCVKKVVLCHRRGFMLTPKIIPEPVVGGSWGQRRSRQPGTDSGQGYKHISSDNNDLVDSSLSSSSSPSPTSQLLPSPSLRSPTNKPLDCAVAALFDTAFLPPIIQRSHIGWAVHDLWVRIMFWLISGTPAGLDQWAGGADPDENHVDALFMVKSTIASPYFNPPFRPSGFTPLALLNCLRSFLINVPILPVLEDEKIIDLAPWPSYFDDAGRLHFSSANRCHRPEADRMISQAPREIDLIVLATGYKQAFPFLPQSSSLDKINCNDADSDEFDNYPIPATCDVRGIWSSSFGPSVAFIGFIRPTIGAIPPLSELQAMLWLHKLFLSYFPPPCRTSPSGVVVPPYELSFSLQPRGGRDLWRSHRGVDGEAYAYQLALDMGAAPTFSYLTHTYNWKVVWTYLMGPNFGTKFRLVGPWAAFGGSNSDSSADIATPSDYNTNNSYSLPSSVATEDPEAIMQGELFDITSRTGGIFFFITYTIIPLLGFGILSAVVVLAQGLSGWIHNIRCVVRRVYGRWTEKIFSFGGNE